MRVVPIVVVVALLSFPVLADEASKPTGASLVLEVDSNVVSSITHSTDLSYDETPWSVEIVLTPDATSNNTTVMLNPLVCDITGFCYPPSDSQSWVVMSSNDNGSVWTSTITPPMDHDYIEYAISTEFKDDDTTQRMPSVGYGGKVWAQCHYVNDTDDSGFNEDCPLKVSSTSTSPTSSSPGLHPVLPSPAVGVTLISLSLIALWKRDLPSMD